MGYACKLSDSKKQVDFILPGYAFVNGNFYTANGSSWTKNTLVIINVKGYKTLSYSISKVTAAYLWKVENQTFTQVGSSTTTSASFNVSAYDYVRVQVTYGGSSAPSFYVYIS